MPYAKKIDSNQNEIIAVLRQVGALVFDTSRVGQGYPDTNVLYQGRLYLLEIKSGRWRFTPQEAAFHAEWGEGPVYVVETPEQALQIIGAVDG